MTDPVILDVPYIFQGIAAPRCHVASLRMILEFYGLRYTTSYLMNLSGYNYGFTYFNKARRAIAGPATALGPWEVLGFAAAKLGCSAELYKDQHWDMAFELMKECLHRGKPVYVARLDMQFLWKTPQPTPHVVVVCGYNPDKREVTIHDPALGEAGEGLPFLSKTELPEGTSGRYARFSLEDFRKACALEDIQWAFSGKNAFCIIEPPSKQRPISWREVMERNSRFILGDVQGAAAGDCELKHGLYGPDGLEEFARDLEIGFGLLEEPARLSETLRALRGLLFRSGSSYMFDASSFVAGLSTLNSDPCLMEASNLLASIGLYYDQGLAGAEYLIEHPAIPRHDLRRKLQGMSDLFRRAAECAMKAGKKLKRGAESLA